MRTVGEPYNRLFSTTALGPPAPFKFLRKSPMKPAKIPGKSFPADELRLADDLMEPLRPWIDRELRLFLQGGERPMQEWMKQAVKVLSNEVRMGKAHVRLLNAIDLYLQGFAEAALARLPLPLRVPMLA